MTDVTNINIENLLKDLGNLMKRISEVCAEIGFFDDTYNTLLEEETTFDLEAGVIYVTAYNDKHNTNETITCGLLIDYLYEPEEKHKNICVKTY